MSPSKGFVALSLGFISGISATYAGFNWGIFALTIFLSLLFLVFAKSPAFLFVSCVLLGASLGYVRSSLGAFPLNIPQPATDVQQHLIGKLDKVGGGIPKEMFSAMTLGDTRLSEEAKEVLNNTGTRHIVSISGLHMTVVALIVFKILIFLGMWRRQAFYSAVICITLYVLMVGAPAPAVRAGIVASLYLAATHIQRLVQPWRLLLAAGIFMLLVDPHLISSVSFQLSFAAMCGILFLHPFIRKKLSFISWGGVRDLISVSLAAQLTTWPIVAYVFGSFSIIGIFANLLVVPVLPIVMILGIGYILLGWLNYYISAVFVWPAWVILQGVYKTLAYLSSLTHVVITTNSLSLWVMILYYLTLGYFFFKLGAQKYINEPAS